MMKNLLLKRFLTGMTILPFLFLALLNGCGEGESKAESKSMEQIQKKEGIPVSVEIIKEQKFEKYLSLFADLQGIKQSKKSSMVGDKIMKINARIGDFVKNGQVVVEFPNNNPAIQYTQAKTALDNSERNYKRIKALVEAGDVAQVQLDGAETMYNVDKRNFQSIRQLIEVESPIDGIITEMPFKEGDAVNPGDPLFTVAQLNMIIATVWTTEEEVRWLKTGMPANIKSGDKVYTGRISEIGIAMDANRKAFRVQITIPNPDRFLRPGVTSSVEIKIYQNPKAIVIPDNLIQKTNGDKFVYLEEQGKAVKREIETGMRYGLNTEVVAGISVGDRLINKGFSLLEDGKKVKVVD